MTDDHDRMRRCVASAFVLVLLGATACTKPNPRSCADGNCTDPAFPFCDTDATFNDNVNTCIAVECTPGEFAACRGDQAITCNSAGSNFDLVRCELGCDDASGCRLCAPSETACTNGTVATCDANGVVVSMQSCPLGCFEDEPRCRDIDPSNGLAQFLDMVVDPPDLDLSVGATIDTFSGSIILNGSGGSMTVPTFEVPAGAGGAPIRVFVVRDAKIGDVVVLGGPALAIVASGNITLDGTLVLGENRLDSTAPGALRLPGCEGGPVRRNTINGSQAVSGAGGGGHATAGGKGGDVEPANTVLTGSAGGATSGNPTLVPLRGGCGSDGFITGGGAVQMSSRTQIRVSGTVDARGGSGDADPQLNVILGGGAGGGILMEAPVVELGSNARLLATGGGGASDSGGPTQSESTAPSLGGQCNPPSAQCGAGGNGAGVGVAATAGSDVAFDGNKPRSTSGGGGGGIGFVRINTRTGDYTKSSSTIEAAVLTTGAITTR